MPATPSPRLLALLLLVVAVVLVVLALVREGNNTWIALLGGVCALTAAAVGSIGRRGER